MTQFAKTFRSGEANVSVEFQFENLPPASVAFLLDYGAKQYLSDGMAMAEADKTKLVEAGEDPDRMRIERVKRRWAALVEGTPSVRTRADTMSPEERMFVIVRDEWLRLALRRTGKKLPSGNDPESGKSRRTLFIEAFGEKNRPAIWKEATKRLRDNGKVEIDLDLGDI